VTGTDLASPFTGPNPGPPFPGEDFLTGLPAGIVSPVNLADGGSMVVITVEPDLGRQDPTGAGPISIKPLAAAVPQGAGPRRLVSAPARIIHRSAGDRAAGSLTRRAAFAARATSPVLDSSRARSSVGREGKERHAALQSYD